MFPTVLSNKYLLCYIYQIQSHNGCVELESVFQYPEKLWDSSKNSIPPPPRPGQGGLWPASVGIQRPCKTSIDQPVLNGVETLLLSCTAEVNTTFYWGNNQNQGKKYTLPTDFYFPQTNIFSWVSIYYCTFGMTEVETNKCPGNNYRACLIYCPVCHPANNDTFRFNQGIGFQYITDIYKIWFTFHCQYFCTYFSMFSIY